MNCNDLIGKPFRDMGRGPDAYDCWGLVIEVARRFGITVPDYGTFHYYDKKTIADAYSNHLPEYEWVDDPRPGDIVVYKRINWRLHFGIVVEPNWFLHTGPDLGVKRNRYDHPMIKQMIEGFLRCQATL